MNFNIYKDEYQTERENNHNLTFNRHQSFYFREGWLRKGINAIIDEPGFFLRKDADQVLGLGKNMIASLRYWLVASGMTNEVKEKGHMIQHITPVGQIIMDYDPYFEYNGTLWIVHNLLASNMEKASTWYWFFNRYAKAIFDKEDFVINLERWTLANMKEVSVDSLNRDFECFVRTYLSFEGTPEDILVCPLGNLGLMELVEDKSQTVFGSLKKNRLYRFKKPELKGLDPLIIGWALIRWQREYKQCAFQVSFNETLRDHNSPGRLFNLSASLLIEVINRLNEQHPDLACRIIRSNNLDLIELPKLEPEQYILRYYQTEGLNQNGRN